MNRGSTFFLRGAVIFIGLVILALCIFALPVGISDKEAGGYRLILAGLYIPAIPFYFALYQALKLLGNIDRNKAFSASSVAALMKIKYSAITVGALFAAGMPYIYQVADTDDAPGVVAIGLIIIAASFVIATFAGVLQKLLRNAIDIKSENDLTV